MNQIIAGLLIVTLAFPTFALAENNYRQRSNSIGQDDDSPKPYDLGNTPTAQSSENAGGTLIGTGVAFALLGAVSLGYSAELKRQSEEPIKTKYSTTSSESCTWDWNQYYTTGYGYVCSQNSYTTIDYSGMIREAEDRKDKAEQSDTYKTAGIVALGGGLILLITGAALSGSGGSDSNKGNDARKRISLELKDGTPFLTALYRY